MKRFLNSFIIAFSMYSKIPMPHCEWNEDNMKYAMCFWPWVGAVIGLLCYGWGILGSAMEINSVFFTVVLLMISVFVTGGIHLDGLLDTADAMSSWQTRERRLEILKDSNAGAFAVIHCVVYFFLYYAVYCQMDLEGLKIVAISFMLSRSLSAFAIVTFPKARKDGSVATWAKGAETKIVRAVMVIYAVCLAALMIVLNPVTGCAVLAGAVIVFAYYHHMAMKYFGGTTGDLAGWFLSVCELVMAFMAAVVPIVLGVLNI